MAFQVYQSVDERATIAGHTTAKMCEQKSALIVRAAIPESVGEGNEISDVEIYCGRLRGVLRDVAVFVGGRGRRQRNGHSTRLALARATQSRR